IADALSAMATGQSNGTLLGRAAYLAPLTSFSADQYPAPRPASTDSTETLRLMLCKSVNMMLRKSIDTGVPQEHLYPPAENTNAPTSSPNVAPDTASLN
ncbi:hypothetical protein EV121DRAFT_164660, partial [Schizophyllum commune]